MKIRIFAAFAAAIMLTASCGVMAPASGTAAAPANNTVTTNGSGVGTALAGLYTQYKTDGRLDMTNLNNIINIATVLNDLKTVKSTGVSALKSQDFINGLISGSMRLINKNNSGTVVDNLATLAGLDLSSITNAAKTAASAGQAAAQTAANKINTTTTQMNTAINALNNIFAVFK